MAIIVAVRHGQSEFNGGSRFCGWVDAPLTELGRQQAKEVAHLIQNNDLTKNLLWHGAYTSRLRRAITTANIILEELNEECVDLKKSWRLNERHYGSLQGKVKHDILLQYGEEQFKYWRRNVNGKPPNADKADEYYRDTIRLSKFDDDLLDHGLPEAESLKDVINRFEPILKQEILEHSKSEQNVLLVTHGSVVRSLLKILYSLPDHEVENLNIPNGIPIVINLDQEGKVLGSTWEYLDEDRFRIESEKVKMDGLKPVRTNAH